MFECLILGDSIGLGTAKAINSQYAPRCDVQAAEGATAAQILSWRRPIKIYGSCVFAIGSNDPPGAPLASIAELCRKEGIAQSLYYTWSKEFMEAGKRRLAGDTARAATTGEVQDLRREARALKGSTSRFVTRTAVS